MCRMREKVGMKVVRALKRNNDGVSHAAIDMLCALMQVIVFSASSSMFLGNYSSK